MRLFAEIIISFEKFSLTSKQDILNFINMTISMILILRTVKLKLKAYEKFQFFCVIVGNLFNISSTVSAVPFSPVTWLTVNYCYSVSLPLRGIDKIHFIWLDCNVDWLYQCVVRFYWCNFSKYVIQSTKNLFYFMWTECNF